MKSIVAEAIESNNTDEPIGAFSMESITDHQYDIDHEYATLESISNEVEAITEDVASLESIAEQLESVITNTSDGVSLETINAYRLSIENVVGEDLFNQYVSLESAEDPTSQAQLTLEGIKDLIKNAKTYLDEKSEKLMERMRWFSSELFSGLKKSGKELKKLSKAVKDASGSVEGTMKPGSMPKSYMVYDDSVDPDALIKGMNETIEALSAYNEGVPEVLELVSKKTTDFEQFLTDQLKGKNLAEDMSKENAAINSELVSIRDEVQKAVDKNIVGKIDGKKLLGNRQLSYVKKKGYVKSTKTSGNPNSEYPIPSADQLSSFADAIENMQSQLMDGKEVMDELSELIKTGGEFSKKGQAFLNRKEMEKQRTSLKDMTIRAVKVMILVFAMHWLLGIMIAAIGGTSAAAIAGGSLMAQGVTVFKIQAIATPIIFAIQGAAGQFNTDEKYDPKAPEKILDSGKKTRSALMKSYIDMVRFNNSVMYAAMKYSHAALKAHGVDANNPKDHTQATEA